MATTAVFGQAHGALAHAAGLVGAARSDLAGQARRLDGQLAGLGGRWGGDGARAFAALHQAWGEQHRRVVGALDRFETSLLATERDNTEVDQRSAGALHRLVGQLGAV